MVASGLLERIVRSLAGPDGPLRAELVLVLDPDRPSAADRTVARDAAAAAAAVVSVRARGPLVVQVAIDAPGPERVETVAICHLERSATDPAVAEIEGVLTVPTFRGRGLGGAVVVEAAVRARADDVEVVWLRTPAGGPAEPLYRRLGFTAIGSVGPD